MEVKMVAIDMELPSTCELCRFNVDNWCYAINTTEVQWGYPDYYKRPDWCPLIPLIDLGWSDEL